MSLNNVPRTTECLRHLHKNPKLIPHFFQLVTGTKEQGPSARAAPIEPVDQEAQPGLAASIQPAAVSFEDSSARAVEAPSEEEPMSQHALTVGAAGTQPAAAVVEACSAGISPATAGKAWEVLLDCKGQALRINTPRTSGEQFRKQKHDKVGQTKKKTWPFFKILG